MAGPTFPPKRQLSPLSLIGLSWPCIEARKRPLTARNFEMHLQEENLPCEIIQRDRDTKYVAAFDQAFTASGREIKITPIKSPNLQAFIERVIQTIKHEVLSEFCVVSEEHLNYILRTTMDWYNHRRGHSGREHLPPIRAADSPTVFDFSKDRFACREELGGTAQIIS